MLAFPSGRIRENCLSHQSDYLDVVGGRLRSWRRFGSAAHPNALPVNTVQSFYSRPSVTLGEKKGIRVIICAVVEAPSPDGRATVFDHMASRIANPVLVGTKVAVRT